MFSENNRFFGNKLAVYIYFLGYRFLKLITTFKRNNLAF